jgi:hypothetical protein
MRKKLKPALNFAILIALESEAYLLHVTWAENIFRFFSIVIAIILTCAWVMRKEAKEYLESYRNGEHLPKLADGIFYLIAIVVAVGSGHWFIGVCWLVAAMFDSCLRDEALKEPERPKIVCICGSSRFADVGAVKAWGFEKQGILALGMNFLPAWYPNVQQDHQAEAEGVSEILDALHLKKIEMADSVFVLNVGGYIGERTRAEIKHALSLGKPIEYLERPGKAELHLHRSFKP